MRRRDPYQWYDAFELLDRFDSWAADLEERHRIEMAAVSRSSWEAAMAVRSQYEQMLHRMTSLQASVMSLVPGAITLIKDPR